MNLPADLHRPAYGTQTLADVLPGVATALGVRVERDGLPADPLGLTEALGGARRIAVLLVDGLGADLIRAHADLAPTLAAMAAPAGDLSAPCPSTTPVSLATLGTGLPPGSHGILGFVTAVPGEDRTLNHVVWRDDPAPEEWQARRTVFEQAADDGVEVSALGPYTFKGSGLTRAVYRGAGYPGSVGAGDLNALMVQALAAAPRTLVYGYLAELDLTGHVRGVDSASWRAQLELIDRAVELLVAQLPDDAALLVTADHGMLDVPRRDAARPRPDARAGGGGPAAGRGAPGPLRARRGRRRGRRPGRAGAPCSATGPGWSPGRRRSPAASSGRSTTPSRPASATSSPSPAAPGRSTATEREPGPSRLIGYHGSLTATELAIPLLAARGSALG